MVFEKKKHKVLADGIAEDIKNAIIKGEMKPGERIIESQIAKEMDVSRSPLREAIQKLMKKNLLTIIPYKGIYVNILGKKEIEDIYNLRVILEAYAIEKIIEKKDKKILQILSKKVKNLKDAVKKGQIECLAQKDMEFHHTICLFANNKKLIEIWEGFAEQIEILINLEEKYNKRLEITLREHEELLSLIEQGKIVESQKKIRSHILDSLEFLKGRINLNK